MNLENIDKFVLQEAKQIILYGFDANDRHNKIINIKKDNYEFTIERRCFHTELGTIKYYEDYRVYFSGTIDNTIVTSGFYMEWVNNIVNGELLPANTRWNPETGEFSQRNIKIRLKNIDNTK